MSGYLEPPMNLKGIGEVIGENTLKDNEGFQYAGLWLFSGSQGSGKTLMLMHLLKEVLKESPKAIVVSNIAIYGIPTYQYTGIEDFDKYVNGADGVIFVIDEIQGLFNSLESKNLPLSSVLVWSQNRKNRRLILGTSQRFNRIAKPIREQATWIYNCKKGIGGVLYSYSVYDGDEFNESGEYVGEEPKRHFYVPQVSVMRMYNTLEVVKRQ